MHEANSDKVCEATGVIGHSQGGGAVLGASGHPKVKAVISLQGAPGMAQNKSLPFLALSGTADMFGAGTNPGLHSYPGMTGPKFYLNLEGGNHLSSASTSRSYIDPSIGWFSAFLQNNSNALKPFKEGSCSQFPGKWQACKGENLSN